MQRHPRILVYHSIGSQTSQLAWCDLELNHADQVELIKLAPANKPAMSKQHKFISQAIKSSDLLILPIILSHDETHVFYVIYQQQLYAFSKNKFALNSSRIWHNNSWSAVGFKRLNPSFFKLTEAQIAPKLDIIRSQFSNVYKKWQKQTSLWLNANFSDFSFDLKSESVEIILNSEFYTLLINLKTSSSTAESYCLALYSLLNRKDRASIINQLNSTQQECVRLLDYDHLYSPNLSYLKQESRVASYNFMTQLLFHELAHYRRDDMPSFIIDFHLSKIESCHYLEKPIELSDDPSQYRERYKALAHSLTDSTLRQKVLLLDDLLSKNATNMTEDDLCNVYTQTYNLLCAEPGEYRNQCLNDYAELIQNFRNRPAAIWQNISLIMLGISACVIALGMSQIIPSVSVAYGLSGLLMSYGLYHSRERNQAPTRIMQEIREIVFDFGYI